MLMRMVAVLASSIALCAQTSAPPRPDAPGAPAAPASTSANSNVLDTPALEAYFRHLLMWPPSVEVTISNPEAAPMPGYYKVKVRGSLGGKSQEENFIVSSDSQTVIRGEVYDAKKNPFQSTIDILKIDDQPFLGIPGAPVTVVEFGDFQCPYCKQEAATVRTQLMQAFPGDVQLFYMDYPLASIHPYARSAAVLGRCIYSQNNGSFWAYHDWIFEHQDEITPENLREKTLDFAKTDKNLSPGTLTACAVSQQAGSEVDRSVALGEKLGINATPTLFVNGRRMVGTVSLEDLKMVVEHEIAYVKAAKKAADCCSVQLSLPGMAPTGAKAPPK